MPRELEALAHTHGSDKASHGYCDFYEELFAPLRERPLRVLELGIGGFDQPDDPAVGGASLRMWRDFFPHATMVGLDVYDKSGVAGDRIVTVQGGQDDPVLLRRLVTEFGPFDIVIDDASHVPELTNRSFELLYPSLADGGVYVIEDLATSYWPLWGGRFRLAASGTTMALVKRRLDGLNHAEFKLPRFAPDTFDTSILEIRARHNIVAFVKGANTLASDLNRPNPVGLNDWVRRDLAPVAVQRLRHPAVLRAVDKVGARPLLGRVRRALVPNVSR